jgi:hypothetical protein
MKRLAWVEEKHLQIRQSQDPLKGMALHWIGPFWDGNIRPLAIPYGGRQMQARTLTNLQKNGPAVHAVPGPGRKTYGGGYRWLIIITRKELRCCE